MSKKSCLKSVSGITNTPKNTRKINPTVTFVFMHRKFKSKCCIGFECPHLVIFSLFRIFIICLIYKCYGNNSKKTTMTFAFEILKQMLLHTYFIPCIFFNHCFCNCSMLDGIHRWFPLHIVYYNAYMREDISDNYHHS